MRKIGIVAMDRSGSDANKPYVVVSVFTGNKSIYPKVYNDIRKLCPTYNPVLGYTKEIKSTKDQSLFDFLIQEFIEKTFGIRPFVKSLDSRFEDGIKIADLVAGFFRNNEIKNTHRKLVSGGMIL